MSNYTEAEHAVALIDTLYWIKHPPITPESRYRYGRYHWRLKDFNEAYHWFCLALTDNVEAAWFDIGLCLIRDLIDPDEEDISVPGSEECFQNAWQHYSSIPNPDSEELYRKAWMLRHGHGTQPDPAAARLLFEKIPGMHPDLTTKDFEIYCDYSVDGSDVAVSTDVCKLPVGDAFLELAEYKLEESKKIGNSPEHITEARRLLKKAYDYHCEEALFYDYRLFGTDFEKYEYQDDIRQLFSFRIGQYGRVCDVDPSRKAYLRLIHMYESGYPGDTPQRCEDFARKADKYYKKIEALDHHRQK